MDTQHKLLAEKRIELAKESMRAILALDDVDFKKHSAVISYFRYNYIATGILPVEFSDLIGVSFDMRSDCDYDDEIEPEKDEVGELLKELGKIVLITEEYIDKVTK